MKKSLQKIEDYYIQKGLFGNALRRALESDKEYQSTLSVRQKDLTRKFKITLSDKEKYVLSTDNDYEILGKIYKLEEKKLSAEDKRIVKFIRTQLERDWRAPIIKELDRILRKQKQMINAK